MVNQHLVDKVRAKLKTLAGVAEEKLAKLLAEYESAAHLAHYPERLTEGKPERFKSQVRQRANHWAEKCHFIVKRLERAVEKY